MAAYSQASWHSPAHEAMPLHAIAKEWWTISSTLDDQFSRTGSTASEAEQDLILAPVPAGFSRFFRALRGQSMSPGGSTTQTAAMRPGKWACSVKATSFTIQTSFMACAHVPAADQYGHPAEPEPLSPVLLRP